MIGIPGVSGHEEAGGKLEEAYLPFTRLNLP